MGILDPIGIACGAYFFRAVEEIIEPSSATAEDGNNSRGVS